MKFREALQWVGVGAMLGLIVLIIWIIPAWFEAGLI